MLLGMGLTWFSAVVDCRDPEALAEFWCGALGFVVVSRTDREVDIAPAPGSFPGMALLKVDVAKAIKNRLHFDLNPQDRSVEVARLVRLGASVVDVGQPADAPWTVLVDAEGNEFCVLEHQAGW
jgi:catechol 2,3-dioxygenase-like lactoylglutathione lyase family enzyme